MQWTYDPTVDALTIVLAPNKRSTRTCEAEGGILLDFDARGHPVAIELLDASRHFPRAELERLPLPVGMMLLSEAAKFAGLDAATLRQQIARKRLVATKRHGQWWVDEASIQTYLDSRSPQGRRGGSTRGAVRRRTRRA